MGLLYTADISLLSLVGIFKPKDFWKKDLFKLNHNFLSVSSSFVQI